MNRGPRRGGRDGATEDFSTVLELVSDGSSKISSALSPLINDPLSIQANSFEYYRFTKLSFRLHPTFTGGTTYTTAVYFYSGVPDAAPAGIPQIMNSDESTLLTSAALVPSSWVNVNRRVLAGKQPWYKAVAGTPEAIEEIQGYFLGYTEGGTSKNVTLQVTGTIQFKGVTDSAATPPLGAAFRLASIKELEEKVKLRQAERQEAARARTQAYAVSLLAQLASVNSPTATKAV